MIRIEDTFLCEYEFLGGKSHNQCHEYSESKEVQERIPRPRPERYSKCQ